MVACEQALLFGRAKRAVRERTSEGPSPRFRVPLARLLFTTYPNGELARRLTVAEIAIIVNVQIRANGYFERS